MKKIILLALIAGCGVKQPAPAPAIPEAQVVCRFNATDKQVRGDAHKTETCDQYWQTVEQTAESTGNTSLLFCYILDKACGIK